MPVDALFEKLRLAERRLAAAEERVFYCRATATKASAVLGGECVSRSRDVTAHENAVTSLTDDGMTSVNMSMLMSLPLKVSSAFKKYICPFSAALRRAIQYAVLSM